MGQNGELPYAHEQMLTITKQGTEEGVLSFPVICKRGMYRELKRQGMISEQMLERLLLKEDNSFSKRKREMKGFHGNRG